MTWSRRELLKMGLFGSAALLLPLERVTRAATAPRIASTLLPRPFTLPFQVPPTARPDRHDAATATDHYAMSMVQVERSIIPGYVTKVWNYRDGFGNLNPTIDVSQGRQVHMQQSNLLPRNPQLGYEPPASLHLHGSASLPQYDGYASDVTMPGQYKDYYYPNMQEARTLWYHDHGMHRTASNDYLGLAAMYRLFDPLEQSLPIPHGPYDIPLIVTDAMFDADGQLLYRHNDESGVYGDVILVNGVPWPAMPVERRKYRFRVLNASVSRGFRWRLDTREPFTVIATDGGLVAEPITVRQMRHGVAERYEIIIDFSKYPIGQRVVLQNLSNKNNIDYPHTNKVMAFDVVAEASTTDDNHVPDVLNPDNEIMQLTASMATATRTLDLRRHNGLWTINGKTWSDVVRSDHRSIVGNPQPGDVEIWRIQNEHGGWNHPVHIHLIDFQILDRNGRPPKPWERGPKDVVYLAENETVRVLTRYRHQKGKYMIHCHNLVHEDHDMMVQYEVGSGGDDPITAAPPRPLPAPPV